MHDNSQYLIMMPCLQRNSRIVEKTVYHKKKKTPAQIREVNNMVLRNILEAY